MRAKIGKSWYKFSAAVNCALTDTTSIHNGVPLISTLKRDDSFWAGDFEVKVTEANGNGTFNGKGIITVPYLQQAQINVILKDVRVNEECQMVAGEVKVEGVGAAILSEELANALNDLLGTLEDIDGVLGAVEDVFNTISTVINASSEVNSVLSTNWNVLHGADPIYNEYPDLPDSLRQQINEALLCYLSRPPSVCNAQLSQTIANLIAAINALFEADYAIRFRDFSQQHYGFDSLMYQPMVDDYNFLTVANQPYRVAWKSVEAGRTDSVLLLTPFAQLPDSLHFETNSRTPVPHHEHACGAGCADNGAAILPVTGGEHNTVYQIYPVQRGRNAYGEPERKYAGKLNVVSYNNKVTQVVIVPINGAGNLTDSDRAAIESQLNEIYRPAVASFTVEPLRPLQLDWFATEAQNTLDSTNSAFYADYNAQMQRINQEINRLPGYDPEKYYLIVVQSAQGGIKGFMPRARNKGFIVAAGHGSLSDLGRTMAHELGHGAFRLRHPWEQFSGLVPGQTDNLMDYASGTRLHHYQWHIVHNPPMWAGMFDSDDDGQIIEQNSDFYVVFLDGIVDIEPVFRANSKTFPETVLDLARQDGMSTFINGIYYGVDLLWQPAAVAGALVPLANVPIEGHIIHNNTLVAGESSPEMFYLAYDKQSLCSSTQILSAFSSGFGNPPIHKTFAIGGAGPLIINGLPYGNQNEYFPEVYRYNANPPLNGWPPNNIRAFLKTRSNATYESINDEGASKGKTCIGVSDAGVFIYVQKDAALNGYTLDQVRDMFIRYNCWHAIFLDGSDSTLLHHNKRLLITQGTWKPNTCPMGLKFTKNRTNESCD